jgi:recombination protein RecR
MTPLAQLLARLPRVGEATAARLAQAIGEQPDDYREALARAIEAERPVACPWCRDVPDGPRCRCQDPAIACSPILVVASPAARRAVCRAWTGQCHVLGDQRVAYLRAGGLALVERCRDPGVRDVVLALGDPVAERQIADVLRPLGVDLWTLGQGIAFGHVLEHASNDEIVASLTHRVPL